MRDHQNERNGDAELDEALNLLRRDARTSESSLAGVRERVLAAARAESEQRARAPRRWLPALAAAAAVVMLGALVPVAVSWWNSTPPTPSGSSAGWTDAAQVLNAAADALDKSRPPPSPTTTPTTTSTTPAASVSPENRVTTTSAPALPMLTRYHYIAQHTWTLESSVIGPNRGYSYLREQMTERWTPVSPGNSERRVDRRTIGSPQWVAGTEPPGVAPLPASANPDGSWQGQCRDLPYTQGNVCGDTTGPGDPAFYPTLPRDPDGLFRWLIPNKTSGGAPDVNNRATAAKAWHVGVDTLLRGLMPADLRADWYRALARIPGLRVTAPEVTIDGRAGVAVGLDDATSTDELILDPHTGEFIGKRMVAGPAPAWPWLKPGTMTGLTTVTTAIVGEIGRYPGR